jgi:hypothetical protein
MSQTLTNEEIDRHLAAFFKAELPEPWPGPPEPAAASEPSMLVAERAAAENGASPVHRDHVRKSRYTLAAAVALLLGASWILTSGLPSSTRPANGGRGGAPDVLAPSDAKTPGEIRDALSQPVAPPGDKKDMFEKAK